MRSRSASSAGPARGAEFLRACAVCFHMDCRQRLQNVSNPCKNSSRLWNARSARREKPHSAWRSLQWPQRQWPALRCRKDQPAGSTTRSARCSGRWRPRRILEDSLSSSKDSTSSSTKHDARQVKPASAAEPMEKSPLAAISSIKTSAGCYENSGPKPMRCHRSSRKGSVIMSIDSCETRTCTPSMLARQSTGR